MPPGQSLASTILGCIAAVLVLAGSAAGDDPAEPAEAASLPPLPRRVDFSTRSRLSGDWFGSWTRLEESGVTFFGDLTQYYQGVTTGGKAQRFAYGGRGDYLLDLDTGKLGLWRGGRLDLRGETRLGQDCNEIDGGVALSNFAMALPRLNQNLTALTGLQYTHDVSERLSVFVGKLNLLDGTPTAYARGMRLNYFWNAAMQSNLTRTYLLPSALGTGFTVRNAGEPAFNFYLLDTHYIPETSGLSTLFSNGMVAYGEYRRKTSRFGLPGHGTVGFLYSTATRTAIDSNPYLLLKLALAGQQFPSVNSAWTATYRFDQILYVDSDDPKRTWVLNGDFGITDGNPNPIRWFGNLSLVGSSPIPGRESDTIGIGYYHLGVSRVPILTIHGIRDENGVEVFYNAAVTPWCHVTPDFQVLDPAQQRTAPAVLVGLRVRLSF